MIKQILFTLSLVLTTASCAPKYVQVLDAETKKPIEGANCSFLFKGGNPFTPSYGSKRATSNKNGKAWVTIPVGPLVSFQGITAEKIGYYSGRRSKDPAYEGKILLRPVKNPVNVKEISSLHLERTTDLTSPIQYDLLIGDWLPPRGKGVVADLEYVFDYEKYVDNNNYEIFLTLKFTDPRSGFYHYLNTDYTDSYFNFPYEAAKSGYENEVVLFRKCSKIKNSRYGVNEETSPFFDRSIRRPGLYIFKIYRDDVFYIGTYLPREFSFGRPGGKGDLRLTVKSSVRLSLEPNSYSLEFGGKNLIENQKKFALRRQLNKEREKRHR